MAQLNNKEVNAQLFLSGISELTFESHGKFQVPRAALIWVSFQCHPEKGGRVECDGGEIQHFSSSIDEFLIH